MIQHGDPIRLAALLGRAAEDSPRWLAGDLGEILAHQLRAPLMFDLQRARPDIGTPARVARDPFGRPNGTEIHSLGELLVHPSPPLALLRLAKEFAKTSDEQGKMPLPVDV